MYWGGGLFLFLCIVCYLPFRLQFAFAHSSAWHGTVTIHFLWFSRTAHYPEQEAAHETSAPPDAEPSSWKRQRKCQRKHQWKYQWKKSWSDWRRCTSFQIHWHAFIDFCKKTIRIISRRLQVEHLSLQCDIGFSRPDWTAYSYGLFWTLLSALPQTWLERGTFTYTPDFQQARQEIVLQGIIRCRVGQLILMIMSLFRLTITAMLEQKRKEQMLYES